MKRKTYRSFILLFTSLLVGSLLLTSCLADTLNKKFGYSVPVVIHYSTAYDTIPKAKKLAAGQALTDDDLPELSEQGYIFDGWYSEPEYINKIEPGAVLSENTTLYAKWTPRTDIPFTIYNFFLDPRSSYGSTFAGRSDLTQHLKGTTNQIINQDSYKLQDSPLYTSELDKYQFIYRWDDAEFNKKKIKADGSTIVNNFYYLNLIYDYEFAQINTVLPDNSWCYWFYFLEESPTDSFNFSSIASAIRNDQRVRETYHDEGRNCTRNRYNKHYALLLNGLHFTSINRNTFYNVKALNQVNLPQTCTRIYPEAFYDCEDLDYVYTDNSDPSKTWKTYDRNGNVISLGTNPNPSTFAEHLRTSHNEFWYE